MGEHGEGDVPVPGAVAAHLVLVESTLVFSGSEAFLDRTPGSGHTDEFVAGGLHWPEAESEIIGFGAAATDEQPATRIAGVIRVLR